VFEAIPRPPAENINVFKSPFYQKKKTTVLGVLERISYILSYQGYKVMFSVG